MSDILACTTWSASQRESFFDAQRRNRRHAKALTGLGYVVVAMVGVLVAVLLSPLLWVVLSIASDLLAIVLPMPNVANFIFSAFELLGDSAKAPPFGSGLITVIVIAMPGFVVFAWLWLRLRRHFKGVMTESTVRVLNARELSPLDPEEQQLRNTIHEMCIAARVAPPTILVYPSGPGVNGLTIGSKSNNATVLIARGALDTLNRSQTQALAAQLIAPVVDDDLPLADLMLSLLQVVGLLRLGAAAPIELRRWPTTRAALQALTGKGDKCERHELCSTLVRAAMFDDDKPTSNDPPDLDFSPMTWRKALRIPWIATYLVGGSLAPMLANYLLLPLFALNFRSRRLLNDAMSVQFTRDPLALGEMLTTMQRSGVATPGPQWLRYAFVAASGGAPVLGAHPSIDQRLKALLAMGMNLDVVTRTFRITARGMLLAFLILICVALFGVATALLAAVNVVIPMLILGPIVGLVNGIVR